MQRETADELHIEMDHVPTELVVADGHGASAKAACRTFDSSKSLGQNLIERLSSGQARFKFICLRAKLLVGQRLVRFFQLVDAFNDRFGVFKELAVLPTGKMLQQEGDHERQNVYAPGAGWQTTKCNEPRAVLGRHARFVKPRKR